MGGTQAGPRTFLARWLNGLGHTKTEIGTFPTEKLVGEGRGRRAR